MEINEENALGFGSSPTDQTEQVDAGTGVSVGFKVPPPAHINQTKHD
jgi:hypothetical protein